MEGHDERRMRRRGLLATILLAASLAAQAASDGGPLGVSATVQPKTGCTIWGGTTLTLAFGLIDPMSGTNATAATSTTIRCRGNVASLVVIVVDGGLSPTGGGVRQLRHTTVATELIPYALTVSPQVISIPKNTDQTIDITGSIAPADFQSAAAGSYSDTVVLSINN